VKCIAWNSDGSNFVSDEEMKKLRFENGEVISNVESYFMYV
jgi:hypothetical protein